MSTLISGTVKELFDSGCHLGLKIEKRGDTEVVKCNKGDKFQFEILCSEHSGDESFSPKLYSSREKAYAAGNSSLKKKKVWNNLEGIFKSLDAYGITATQHRAVWRQVANVGRAMLDPRPYQSGIMMLLHGRDVIDHNEGFVSVDADRADQTYFVMRLIE